MTEKEWNNLQRPTLTRYKDDWTIEETGARQFRISKLGEYRGTQPTLFEAVATIDRLRATDLLAELQVLWNSLPESHRTQLRVVLKGHSISVRKGEL